MPDSAPLTPDELAAIRARVDACRMSPKWQHVVEDSGFFTARSDAYFILVNHAEEDVPRLLAEVERLRALLGEEPS